MVKSRFWIGVTLVPILFATAGCNITHRSFATAKRGAPPRSLMSIAQDLEREGRTEEAKAAYKRVLDVQPDLEALKRLDALYALDAPQQVQPKSDFLQRKTEQLASQPRIAESKSPALAAKPQAPSTNAARKKVTSAVELVTTTEPAKKAEKKTEAPSREPELFLPLPESATKSAALVKSDAKTSVPAKSTRAPEVPQLTDSELDEIGTSGKLEAPLLADLELPPSPAKLAQFDDDFIAESEGRKTDVTAVANANPELLSPSDPLTLVEEELIETPESVPFVSPLVQRAPTTNPELEQFFVTFHMGMVKTLQERRAHFQPMLAEIAADRDADSDVRSRAIFLLGTVGAAAIDVVPMMRREMHRESDEFLRIDLAEAVIKIQPEDADAIGVLLDSLKSAEAEARWIAAFAIRSAASTRTAFVIDPLIAVLDTDDLKLKRMVFLTLAEFGPAATKAVPELKAALESSDFATREVAKVALQSILSDQKTSENSRKTASQLQVAINK